VKFRGKTVVDCIVGELSKEPRSVVFLENIDEADTTVQNSLSQAVKTGKFSDSHGREVGVSNAIFVTTSRFTKGAEVLSFEKETGNYPEESILRAKGWPIQIVIDHVLPNNTRIGISNPVIVNKRKSFGTSEMAKRAHKSSNTHLDLNLPAEEIELLNTDCWTSGGDSIPLKNKAWLEKFVELVDEAVVFKPFDFDKLAEKISKEISECFHKIVGSDSLLEIDSKVMEQIIAAACTFEEQEAKDWVERVLSRGFVEAQKRYNLTSGGYVVKLVACEGFSSNAEVPGVSLPSKILVK